MATVSISDRPVKIISNGSPVITSRWVAAWNPIVYTFTFTDLTDITSNLVVYLYEFGTNTLLSKANYKPINGSLKVNLSSFIKAYLSHNYSPNFSNGINSKDSGSTIKFYIKYQLNTSTTTGSIISDESNYLYVTNSVKQIGEVYGQNMAEFVPYGQEDVLKAKFLTKFDEPVYFDGYPFTLSFIYSELIINHELKLVEDRKNINAVHLSSNETQLDTSQGYSINYIKLQDSYTSNVEYVDVSISTGQPKSENYVYQGYVTQGYQEAR
jgi:hypothetical protein